MGLADAQCTLTAHLSCITHTRACSILRDKGPYLHGINILHRPVQNVGRSTDLIARTGFGAAASRFATLCGAPRRSLPSDATRTRNKPHLFNLIHMQATGLNFGRGAARVLLETPVTTPPATKYVHFRCCAPIWRELQAPEKAETLQTHRPKRDLAVSLKKLHLLAH